MKRIWKILLITLGVLLALFLVGAWMLNRWLQSPAMHAHVERELSLAVRVPLRFGSLSISPWGGISATEITVPAGKGNFFEASKFNAHYSLPSLISGKLVFSEIAIDGPKFVITQNAEGDWKTPPLPPDLQAEIDARKKPKAPKVKSDKLAEPKPVAAAPKPKSGPSVRVAKITITGGAAEMYDASGAPFATLSDIKVTLSSITDEKVQGSLAVGFAVLYHQLAMSNFRATVGFSEERGFVSPGFSAAVGGGTLSGTFATMPQKGTEFGLHYNGTLVLVDVDMVRACTEASAEAPNLTGTLSASLSIKGVGDNRKLLDGKGSVTLRNGTFRELDMVRQLGEFLKLDEVAQFGINEAVLDFIVRNDRFFIEPTKPLTITAPPLILSASGSSKLDGKMKLDAMLSVDESFLEKRGAIASQFGPLDPNGRRSLAFDVGGTWTKPKSNLLDRVTGSTDKTTQKIIVGESVLRRAIEEVKAQADEQKKEEKKK